MKLKKWLILFFAICLVCAAAFAGFNILVDPFGVFGDPVMNWYAYDMTENPRTAKIAYLQKHHSEYDSYVIGSSKASSLSVDELNGYLDASFYNMTWYGGKLWDEERTVTYLLKNYEVKNIVLTVEPQIALEYHDDSDDLKEQMHSNVDGTSPLLFYGSYLFCNPTYSFDKLSAYQKRGFLQTADAVYTPETGSYNKQRRDASPISDLKSYLETEEGPFTVEEKGMRLPFIKESVEAIQNIKAQCEQNNVKLTVIALPLSDEELESYHQGDVTQLLEGIAGVTDYWDFLGYNEINCDPRYFYDSYHYRNCVGTMMLARVFDNPDVYVPEDFGVLDTEATVKARVQTIYNTDTGKEKPYLTRVPILMYHSFVEDAADVSSSMDIAVPTFAEQLKALSDAGYTSIGLEDLQAYVEHGTALPAKPFVITVDDGYANNLTLAAPVLQQYGASATIAVIGCSEGKDTYKDTGKAITPHFSLEEALPWCEKGVIQLISHSYDMHQMENLDGEDCRKGVLQLPDESESDYVQALTDDFTKSKKQLEDGLRQPVNAVAYPFGKNSEISEIVLHGLGFAVTMTSDPGVNDVIKGVPQSLYKLRRNEVTNDMSGAQLVRQMNSLIESEE